MTERVKYCCPKCNSENVVRDAYAEWCVASQDWVLVSTYDNFACNECGAEDINPDEVDVEETPAPQHPADCTELSCQGVRLKTDPPMMPVFACTRPGCKYTITALSEE